MIAGEQLTRRMFQRLMEAFDPPIFVDYTDHDETSSLFDTTYTYSHNKYSCLKEFYYAHIVFNYLIFLTGLGAFISRLLPLRYRWIHSWCGRFYIISMLWSTGTSLLINNTGLNISTLMLFAVALGGLAIGWFAIVIHIQMMNTAATKLVEKKLQESEPGNLRKEDFNLANMLKEAKGEVANSKTFVQRFFSLKAFHGIVFFMSWFGIAGRIFNSNQSGDFQCYTYPAYKPIDTKEFAGASNNVTFVPRNDPDFDKLPWANGEIQWASMIMLSSFVAPVIVGALFSFFAARRAKANRAQQSSTTELKEIQLGSDENTSGGSNEGDLQVETATEVQ